MYNINFYLAQKARYSKYYLIASLTVVGESKMTEQLRVLIALPQDLHLVPTIQADGLQSPFQCSSALF